MRRVLKRLGFGALGALVFLVAWIGFAALGHFAHFPPPVTDVVLAVAGLATYVLYVRATEKRAVTELDARSAIPHVVAGFAIGVGLFAAVIAVLALSGHYRVASMGDPAALLRALTFWFSGAIMEELLFRGFIFRVIRDVSGTWIAVAVSALLFGLLHAANPGATVVSSVAIALEAGVLLAVAYAATNRLWLPIGLHAGWNYAEGTVFGTAVSGNAVKSTFLHGALSGNALVTGGAFGVEASIVAVAVCLVAAAGFALRVKRGRLLEATA
jgi:membrane protease YdiL (CAAX protease family)